MVDELTYWYKQATRRTIHEEGKRAKVGRTDGTVLYTSPSGQVLYSKIWITYLDNDSATQEAVVNNTYGSLAEGTPVRVVTRNGVSTIELDKFSNRAVVFTNGGQSTMIGTHGGTHRRLGSDPRYVEGLAFEPLMVRPSDPVAMTVYVEPGRYMYHGSPKQWRGGDSDSLSSYVPGTDNGDINYIAVCLNASTNAIAIVNGGTVADTDPLFPAFVSFDEVDAISLPSHYIGLAVVEFVFGQTTILPSDIIYDLRTWGGATAADVSFDSIVTDTSGGIVVDANGNVVTGV